MRPPYFLYTMPNSAEKKKNYRSGAKIPILFFHVLGNLFTYHFFRPPIMINRLHMVARSVTNKNEVGIQLIMSYVVLFTDPDIFVDLPPSYIS